MATRKKNKKPVKKKTKTKPAARKKAVPRKAKRSTTPKKKTKRSAPRRAPKQAAPRHDEAATTQLPLFDLAQTQAVPVPEVVGEIEEKMALGRLTES